MILRFHIKYTTTYGQSISISIKENTKTDQPHVYLVPLQYLNDEFWHVSIYTKEYGLTDKFSYHYILYEFGHEKEVLQNDTELNLKKIKAAETEILDEWKQPDLHADLYKTRPFIKLLKQEDKKEAKKVAGKNPTHIFRVKSPEMAPHHHICIAGSAKKMNGWEESDPLLLQKSDGNWTAKLNLSKENFPVEFKVGVYDSLQKKIVFYEDGANRKIDFFEDKEVLHIYNILADFRKYAWKGAGLNIQLSSIKTNRGWGTGDFTDLFLVTDWCKESGMRLIQLLPVNDTTATHTNKDSYPYSAISAFALHPVFLNVQKLATAFSVKFGADILEEVKRLNDEPQMDYEAVAALKQKAIRLLYEKEKQYFKDDLDWFEFFDMNRAWLQPYAAFCYLRDKYKTADFNQWGDYSVYDESLINELTGQDNKEYDDIAIHYFTQYHLHLQLKDATDYAHKNGIVLKADLPIGVGRSSVDTWMYPHLFHMDKQAGAPPDAFATKGQNWSFPTYDWQQMSVDNYAWWRQRMEQLSNYFDAVRIDHVLGFFRIWSIPLDSIEGILGRFIPANALSAHDFSGAGMHFNEARLCDPYITENILKENFGEKAAWIKETFLDGLHFKHAFDTQRKIAAYFDKHPENSWAQQPLFDLLTDVVLIKDTNRGHYHFRINIFATNSFRQLGENERRILDSLYNRYLFSIQDELWKEEGIKKIAALKNASNNMLLCGEDLGMVPSFVPSVLHDMEILSLQVERMPKKSTESFSPPHSAQYDCVVTPSTHDMSTIREWWEEDRKMTQSFYNEGLGHYGEAPFYCEPWIAKEIINQHLYAPAMWSVFLLQDLLAMNGKLRRQNPLEERINVPANPDHVWNYRMHITLEELLGTKEFTSELRSLIEESGR
jgi:4-alpha-glucanotransferase